MHVIIILGIESFVMEMKMITDYNKEDDDDDFDNDHYVDCDNICTVKIQKIQECEHVDNMN